MRYAVSVDSAAYPGGRYDEVINVRYKVPSVGNVVFHCDDVVNAIGRPLKPEEDDWLDLLCAIHVADLLCKRGKNEEWNRHIVLSLPLRQPSYFQPLLPLIREVFGRLTQDVIDIRLEADNEPSGARFPTERLQTPPDAVTLLSGGLDSAAASIRMTQSSSAPCFVSSRSAPHVIAAQRSVIESLKSPSIRGMSAAGFRVEVRHKSKKAPPLPKSDLSQRSRTLLFAGVAALIAGAHGITKVILGENGVMAINCPLTAGRDAGFSTHTAHPDVLSQMGRLFTSVLGRTIEVVNPLLFKTKADVVTEIAAAGLTNLILKTHSCWIARTADHCGICVPCLVRRFATEAAGVKDVSYKTDLFNATPPSGDDKFKNLGDYLLFATNMKSSTDDDLLLEFDELNVEGGIPIQARILGIHRQWANDVLKVAGAYPSLAKLL